MPIPVVTRWVKKLPELFAAKAKAFFGLGEPGQSVLGLKPRVGLAISGLFMVSAGLWIIIATLSLQIAPLVLIALGFSVVFLSSRNRMSLGRANVLALVTHLSALLVFYALYTRSLTLTYLTDTIIGTYVGVLKVLEHQNPYLFTIKPFLDQMGFPPSYYTPRVDGSFEFRIVYPAFNFISVLPFYLAGLHDVRDTILFFHLISILLIFGLVPARLKALGIAPFAIGFPYAIVVSWTDNVWAFMLILSAAFWYRNRNAGLGFAGLAAATKQIALVVAPFMLIRLWHESSEPKLRSMLKGLGFLLAGFFVPNIPFIVLSPSAWWSSIAGPYLPSNNPQIIGGIGLSEMMINLGVAPPSIFFVVLAGIAALVSFYLYSARFDKLRHFVWAMPALILFFYYRSFPNYIAYWLFPLVPELLRYKSGGLNWHPISRLRSITWRPPTRTNPFTFQKRLTAPLLLLILLTAVLAGVSGAYISSASTARVTVQIDGVGDPDRIGAVTNLNVTLTNTHNEPVSPRFFIKWSFLPLIWTSNPTEALPGNSSAGYLLSATDALAAIPRGAMFRVFVYNSITGELAGESKLTQASIMPPGIANPQFKWWTLDPSTARKVPFGWKLLVSNTDTMSSGVEELDQSLAGGIRMELNNTVSERIPSQVALLQRLSFNATTFDMLVLRPPTSDFPNSALFGVQMWDGQHLAYFVLSDSATSRTTVQFAENTTITIPLGTSSWTWVHLDAQSEWSAQGWLTPRWVDISVFLKADARGVYAIGVGQVLEASI